MDPKILESIKGKLDEAENKELALVLSKSIVALGTDEAFALRDSEGTIRAFKQRVTLSERDGTLIQPVPGGPFVVSAQGYEVLSEAAGVCCIFPTDVLVDGKPQANPYVLRDTNNGRVLAVYCRAIAFRFSSKGIPQVADWTTIFDTPSYRLIDLLGKAKKCPAAFKLLPNDMKAPEGQGQTWARYTFDEATTLWINTSHDEALTWFAQIINREKKAIDFAQTFARRNAVKHLLGVQKAPGNVWDVPVLCWRPTAGNIVKWDATQYVELQQRVKSIVSGSGGFAQDKPVAQIDMKAGAERVSDDKLGGGAIEHELGQDDEQAAELGDFIDVPHEDVTDRETEPGSEAPAATKETEKAPERPKAQRGRPPKATVKPQEKAPELSPEERGVMRNYEMIAQSFPAEMKLAMKELGITEGADITPELAAKINSRTNAVIDRQNA